MGTRHVVDFWPKYINMTDTEIYLAPGEVSSKHTHGLGPRSLRLPVGTHSLAILATAEPDVVVCVVQGLEVGANIKRDEGWPKFYLAAGYHTCRSPDYAPKGYTLCQTHNGDSDALKLELYVPPPPLSTQPGSCRLTGSVC